MSNFQNRLQDQKSLLTPLFLQQISFGYAQCDLVVLDKNKVDICQLSSDLKKTGV